MSGLFLVQSAMFILNVLNIYTLTIDMTIQIAITQTSLVFVPLDKVSDSVLPVEVLSCHIIIVKRSRYRETLLTHQL
jgi:hypothetical protein